MVSKKAKVGMYLENKRFPIEIKDNDGLFAKLENTPDGYKSEVIEEIFCNNIRIVHSILNRRYGSMLAKICQEYRITHDELFSLGCEYLLESIYAFDLSKGFKFTTLAYRILHNGFSKYFERIKGVSPMDKSTDETISGNPGDKEVTLLDRIGMSEDIADSIVDTHLIIELLTELKKEFNPKHMLIFQSYISGGVTQSELASAYGISQVQVSRIITKMQARARDIRYSTLVG